MFSVLLHFVTSSLISDCWLQSFLLWRYIRMRLMFRLFWLLQEVSYSPLLHHVYGLITELTHRDKREQCYFLL